MNGVKARIERLESHRGSLTTTEKYARSLQSGDLEVFEGFKEALERLAGSSDKDDKLLRASYASLAIHERPLEDVFVDCELLLRWAQT